MWIEAPNLDTIEVGNKLEDKESELIKGLSLEAFDKDSNKENIDEMKDVLKTTEINLITSAAGVIPETKEALSLWDIATEFDKYVEKGEGWKLKVKESMKIPEWITYIIENPTNNDLAYLVQKIAELVEYQTAREYGEKDQMDAKDVWVDKMFGNQTRRALAGLKAWIENTATTEVAEWKSYEWKYIAKSFLEWLVSGQETDEKKNTALAKYNLQYKDGKIVPLDTYTFVDPNSSNYAVIKNSGNQGTETPGSWWTVETNENTTWDVATIKEQLKWQRLDNDEELIKEIVSKNYAYDSFEYKDIYYITIKKWTIAIYLDKKDFDVADKSGKNEKNKEDITKWNTLREKKIKELLDNIDDVTITDSIGKIGLEWLPWVFFKNTPELNNFKRWRKALIEKFAYASFMDTPFKISDKWNIYWDNNSSKRLFLEDAKDNRWKKYIDIKYVEDYKWDSKEYKVEAEKIVAYLNSMNCWNYKIPIEWIARPY
jgi:hypothetical protein